MIRGRLMILAVLAAPWVGGWMPVCAETVGQGVKNEDFMNLGAIRVNAQVVGVHEVEAQFLESYQLLQEKVKRGTVKGDAIDKALKDAWTAALQTTIQDTLLDQQGAKYRTRIIRSILANSAPGTYDNQMLDAFRRWEEDAVREYARQKIQAAGGEAELAAALKRKGQTLDDWKKSLSREIFRQQVLFDSLGNIPPSPKAGRAYFEAHPDEFEVKDIWRLRRIKIPKNKFSTPEAAQQAAQVIYTKIKEGYDFAQMAADLKYDPPYDASGGLLTVDGQTDLPSGNFPIEERIAKKLIAKDGQYCEPLDLDDQYLIVKREYYKAGVKPTFEDSAEKAIALAQFDRVKQKKQEFYEKQKKDSFVEILQNDPPERWGRALKATGIKRESK
jgi:hypothetical protein